MSQQPEARLSRQIMAGLRARGWFCFKVHGSETMMAGLPDLIVCAQGVFVGLEVKMPSKRSNTSGRQRLVHSQINEAGGYAVVVCGVDEAIHEVEDAMAGIESRMLGSHRDS